MRKSPRSVFAVILAGLSWFHNSGTASVRADDPSPSQYYEYCKAAAKSVEDRPAPGHGRGSYLLEYLGGPREKSITHARARFETWFTESHCRVDLTYEVNHDRFPRSLIVRSGNLHVSHRFRPSPESHP